MKGGLFLIPLFLAGLAFLGASLGKRGWRVKRTSGAGLKGWIHRLVRFIDKKLLPFKDLRYYRWIENKLQYTRYTVGGFLLFKGMLLAVTILLGSLIQLTIFRYHVKEIRGTYPFGPRGIFYHGERVEDLNLALEEELYYFDQVMAALPPGDVKNLTPEELEDFTKELIGEAETHQPKDVIAWGVADRVQAYLQGKQIPPLGILLLVLIPTMVPELLLWLKSLGTKAKAKQELRFLKRLMILHGSIKPVDFMMVLEVLIHRSKYYRKNLLFIQRENKKNTQPNQEIYRGFIQRMKDIDEKLFFEKLDQANNYDFDQAIVNIENEFRLEQRQRMRKVRKQIELIHVGGILGSFMLIALLTLYMLIPWLTAYDMTQMF